jgi:hypothetical protein
MASQQSDRQKNRALGVVLAVAAAAMFASVFGVVTLFRYAEAHHLLAAL